MSLEEEEDQYDHLQALTFVSKRIRRIFNLCSMFPTWVAKVDSYAEASGPRQAASNKVITTVCGERPTRRIRN